VTLLPALVAGAAIGVVYTLSPLTVWFLVAVPCLWYFAKRGLSPHEARWLAAIFCAAVVVRLIALGVLFVTADASVPYANLFGDEEFFKRRSLWLRNLGLGIPTHGADIIYAFDETGQSSYLYVLAVLQALVGPTPYGVHLLNAVFYLFGVLLLYRLVRSAYGGVAALGGLTVLLFLPSLFMWSISALKEPLYILVCAAELYCAVQIVRAPRWWQRIAALAGVIVLAYVLQTLRFGGLALALAGTGAGMLTALLLSRPRRLLAGAVVLSLAVPALVAQPAVQTRLMNAITLAAFQHWGHVATPGHTYQLIEPEYYADRLSVRTMSPPEAGRFVFRAFAAYFTVPLPWRVESRAMLAFLPEQIFWYVLVGLAPIGLVVGLRRDALLTAMIAAHAFMAIAMVALTGGNVGTLVRHRGLALPYVIWISSLGAVAAIAWLVQRGRRRSDVSRITVQPAWP
jgi:hypothetical protein